MRVCLRPYRDQWTPLHFTAQNKKGVRGALDFADILIKAGECQLITPQYVWMV